MQSSKKVVLTMVRYYLPGHKSGGPVRSISNMVELLGDEFDFRIVTSDRDMLDGAPYSGVVIDGWNQVGKAQVYYLSPSSRSLLTLARLISKVHYDVMYLNSFLDPVFSQRPLLARRIGLLSAKPIVLAPRGEFSPRALLLKRWKKVSYKCFSSAVGLHGDLTWHASSEREALDIRQYMDGVAQQIVVASDMAPSLDKDKLYSGVRMREGDKPLRIIFLSRITPMKNLDFLLRVLALVNISVHLNIFGPIEDASYWGQCEGLIARLPGNISVRYVGVVNHVQVATVLGEHDLFFLPTRGENYGHAIMESLLAGTPVLISDTTPWRDLEQAGVGWDLSLDNEQQYANKIHDAAQVANEAYKAWRNRVRAYAHERATDPKILTSNRRLFLAATGKAAPMN